MITEIRDGEEIAFPFTGCNQGKQSSKFSHRAPDGEHLSISVFYPVDRIRSYGIKIIVRKVNNMR
jgi:hypothetical protein